jgi:hypothetical protein
MRRAKRTPRIFLNYRREDTAGHAGRLYEALAEQFGPGSVFMDIDTIRAGEDFSVVVRNAVGSSDSVVAVIGSSWLDVRGGDGSRRLDNPEDYVRLELEGALQERVRVVPVLVQGAKMPSPEQLPLSLAPLARRQAVEVSDNRWSYDVGRLISAIDPDASAPSAPKRRPFASRRQPLAVAPAVARAPVKIAVVGYQVHSMGVLSPTAEVASALRTLGGAMVQFERIDRSVQRCVNSADRGELERRLNRIRNARYFSARDVQLADALAKQIAIVRRLEELRHSVLAEIQRVEARVPAMREELFRARLGEAALDSLLDEVNAYCAAIDLVGGQLRKAAREAERALPAPPTGLRSRSLRRGG